jgi:hypothetical protein
MAALRSVARARMPRLRFLGRGLEDDVYKRQSERACERLLWPAGAAQQEDSDDDDA